MKKTENEKENKNRNEKGEDTFRVGGAAARPPRRFPAFVSVFVFVLIFGFFTFDFQNDHHFDGNYISEARGGIFRQIYLI